MPPVLALEASTSTTSPRQCNHIPVYYLHKMILKMQRAIRASRSGPCVDALAVLVVLDVSPAGFDSIAALVEPYVSLS